MTENEAEILTEEDRLILSLTQAEQPSLVRRALEALGISTPSVADALVVRALFLSAISGEDTSAAKMWLVNRDGENWTMRTRRPKPKSQDAGKEQPTQEPTLHDLRLIG